MASLYKDPRSKYWIGCFTAADGRQLKRSTRETDKVKARQICEAWEKVESLGRKGYLTSEEQFRKVFNDAVERITGKKFYDPSVREWLERWLATEKGAVKPATIRRYTQVVRDFLAFLGTRAETRLEALTTEDFLKFRDTLLGEGRSPQTANLTIRKVLKRPFTQALNEGIIQRNPVAAVRHLKGKRAEKGVFSPEQIVKLLSVADREWRGMIFAGYFTGARLGNIARLKWENIDLVGRSLTFVQEKTDAKIKVPIHPELLEYFQSLKMPADRGKPIFPSLCHLPGPGQNGLSMRFKRLMKRVGIEDGTARERLGVRGHRISSLSYHSLRHGLISALANAGVPPELRKKISGHQDDASHGMYSHHEFETIRKALESVSRLPELPENNRLTAFSSQNAI
jgi:integrase